MIDRTYRLRIRAVGGYAGALAIDWSIDQKIAAPIRVVYLPLPLALKTVSEEESQREMKVVSVLLDARMG